MTAPTRRGKRVVKPYEIVVRVQLQTAWPYLLPRLAKALREVVAHSLSFGNGRRNTKSLRVDVVELEDAA